MWSSLVEYHCPTLLDEALRLLARRAPRTVPLGGGVRLVAERSPTIEAVVDLRALDLDFVQVQDARLRLGAAATLQTLISDRLAGELAAGLLAQAARRTAPRPIRNVATLGGTLVVGGSTSELLLALLVLDAQLVIRAPEPRTVDLGAFLSNRAAHLPSHGLIVEITIPAPQAKVGAALAEISLTPRDRPVVNAAAFVESGDGVCRVARLALGGVAADPIRLPALEAELVGSALDDGVLARVAESISSSVAPPSDARSSAEYRREMAGIVASRALSHAWAETQQE
jgi:probable selenate reductase FAD-binding subunit